MVDWVFAVSDAVNSEHRERFDFVVIAGMVTIGAFFCHFPGMDMSFQNKLGTGGYLQVTGFTFNQLRSGTAQQACKTRTLTENPEPVSPRLEWWPGLRLMQRRQGKVYPNVSVASPGNQAHPPRWDSQAHNQLVGP